MSIFNWLEHLLEGCMKYCKRCEDGKYRCEKCGKELYGDSSG